MTHRVNAWREQYLWTGYQPCRGTGVTPFQLFAAQRISRRARIALKSALAARACACAGAHIPPKSARVAATALAIACCCAPRRGPATGVAAIGVGCTGATDFLLPHTLGTLLELFARAHAGARISLRSGWGSAELSRRLARGSSPGVTPSSQGFARSNRSPRVCLRLAPAACPIASLTGAATPNGENHAHDSCDACSRSGDCNGVAA